MLRTSLDTRILLCLSTIMTGQHPIEATDISTIFTVCIRTQMPPPQAASRKRLHKFPPVRLPALSAPAQAANSILCRAPTFPQRTPRAAMPSTTSAINVITQKISALMCIKTTVPARMVRGLARTAAAIHGCCKVSRQLPAPAMDTVRILAPAVRPRAKPFTPAAIVTVMEAGNSIRPASTGAQALAGTAVRRTMTTLRTA